MFVEGMIKRGVFERVDIEINDMDKIKLWE